MTLSMYSASVPVFSRMLKNLLAVFEKAEAFAAAQNIDLQTFVETRLAPDMTQLVRQLDPGPDGLPLELYCFARTTDWHDYEAIQADIFDHLLAVMRDFDLRLFQHPAGSDVAALAGLRAAA